jgi:hypothetical protein
MNSENSVNEEVKQPVGPGRGCIASLFCIGGTFIGFAGGELILKMSQKGESDESGSRGVILPSYEALNGAFWGGLAGLFNLSQNCRRNGCPKKSRLQGNSCCYVACWNRFYRGGFGGVHRYGVSNWSRFGNDNWTGTGRDSIDAITEIDCPMAKD